MPKYYISTAIAYVNAPPHIGHALEFIQADALARHHRLKADNTFFLTGTDEHGVKVYETAKDKGKEVQDLVDENAEIYKSLKGLLHLSNDDFIRTTSDLHKDGAKKMWKKMVENDDIYKDVYKGNYCAGCESFIPEKDLDEKGECPNHRKKPRLLEEENYFFRLSKYSNQIKEAIESDKLKIVPESRKNEMLNLIGEEGLKDVSFSRPKDVLPWGVNVPDDDTQVMYVWGDALSNYITGMGYAEEDERFQTFWPADVHLIGKDILRFHAGIWIGMLMSAELEIPHAIYVHGFITSEGQKMSKTLGNVVDPLEYVEKYGADVLRYFLLREIPTVDDGDFSHQRFLDVHNSELANGLGNLVNRVLMMTEKYCEGKIPASTEESELSAKVFGILDNYKGAFDGFDLKKACEFMMELVDFANKYIDDEKPWIMDKEGREGIEAVMYNLLEILRILCVFVFPIMPEVAGRMVKQLGIDVNQLSLDNEWGVLKEGTKIAREDTLFPRLEE